MQHRDGRSSPIHIAPPARASNGAVLLGRAMDAVTTLRRAGSVARTGRLIERGVPRREIAAALRSGAIIRLRVGVLALPEAPQDLVVATMENARLTCASAARHYDFWLLHPPTSQHLASHARAADHRIGHHRPLSVAVHPSLPLVGLVDALIHALHCLPAVDAAVMVESSLRRGDTIRPFLLERLQGNRNGRARAVLDLVTCTADSALEVVARILFLQAGLHVEAQVQLDGVGRVDFLLEGFLVVEVDGDAFHSDRATRRKDRRRNNVTITSGYLVLRYGYEDIMFHREDVLAQVLAVLSGRAVR
ncbi:DUF559 domain-containing protein [Arthrobacter agilis]|uniref:DUF559 domain-containing protein n=1 Tax=Arthrobacter agilis TaxID=37921 RepID=UPI000F710B3B|nr:DUF559 domain-containing protein [Arthrobacter agilis]TPV24871.1 DUF559 domain-containing protein [Arthrobacter agilis]VDR31028.1 Protein of uncharacterised function (DUF559) [Arthrobacter agilis]